MRSGKGGDPAAQLLAQLEVIQGAVKKLSQSVRRLNLNHRATSSDAYVWLPPRQPSELFFYEWLQGRVPLPLQVCTAEQLYRGFLRRWLEQGGSQAPPSQMTFTRVVKRWAACQATPPAQYKVIALPAEGGSRRSARCWVPAGIDSFDDGTTEGEWASEQIEGFEQALGSYRLQRSTQRGAQ